MESQPPSLSRHALPVLRGADHVPAGVFLDGPHGALLVVAGLLGVALIALLDFRTGPYLSFSVFYLAPVAVCAWWGGFAHGLLLSLAGAAAWHYVDLFESPLMPVSAAVWNGVVRFGTLALVSSLVSRLHVGVLRERRLARTDALTGAANGRTFFEAATTEAERIGRTGQPLTMAYLDLDDFKLLNDRLGHAAGDAALRYLVRAIQADLRGPDVLARLGGDEFALLLPETPPEGAAALLARLQERLSREMAGKGWPVTLSVGATTFLPPLPDVDHMIRDIDALMYRAKRKGKGRVEHEVVDGKNGPGERRRGERRATARLACRRTARVRRPDVEEDSEAFAIIRDISSGGIGLHLETCLPTGTLLIVEPLHPEGKALLARVIHACAAEDGWKHGCALSIWLGADELRGWLGGSAEEVSCR